MSNDDWLGNDEESEEQFAARMAAIRDEARNAEKPPKVYPTDMDDPAPGYGGLYHADPEFDLRVKYFTEMIRSAKLSIHDIRPIGLTISKEDFYGRMYGRDVPMVIMDELTDLSAIEDRILSVLSDKMQIYQDVLGDLTVTKYGNPCAELLDESHIMKIKPTSEDRRYFAIFDKPEGTRAERRAAKSKRSSLYEKPTLTSALKTKRSLLRGV